MRYKEYEPKTNKFYILYNENDFPVFYADTLKEFSQYFNYNYKYLVRLFTYAKPFNFIHLLVDKKDFYLYTFTDNELINVTL